MSRIGKSPIPIPKGVDIKISGNHVTVKGPKGQLEREFHPAVFIEQGNGELHVKLHDASKLNRKFHGLGRSLLANMVTGVHEGFSRSLTLVGVGYRAQQAGSVTTFSLGHSHPIEFKAPTGITIAVEKQTTVVVSGVNKETVGQVAANIRGFRPPEPYHGKGVRYTEETITTKVGKASGKK